MFLMAFFFSSSVFAGSFDEYGNYSSPYYNQGATQGGSWWSMGVAFPSSYSYQQSMDVKTKSTDQYTVTNFKPAENPNIIIEQHGNSQATGNPIYWVYPAVTQTVTQQITVNFQEMNTKLMGQYGANTYYNYNLYDPVQQRYTYNTYKTTPTGSVLVASSTSPSTAVPVTYDAIPRSESSSNSLDTGPGSKFQEAIQLYDKQTLTLAEAEKVIVDYIDRVIPDLPNGRSVYIQNTISKVANGLPPGESPQAATLLKYYMTSTTSVFPNEIIESNNFPPGKNNIFTASGTVSGRHGEDGYLLQMEIQNVLVKPSQLDRSQPSLNSLVKIVALYAKSKGYTGTVAVTNRAGKGEAFYVNGVLYVRKNTFESGIFDNVNNLKSAIDHEIGHWKESNAVRSNYKFKDHAAIYLLQASSPDFEHTTEQIKISNANQYMNRVLNASKANEVGMNDDGIIQAINTYNTGNTGGVTISNATYSGSLAGFSFTTRINGVVFYNNFSFKVLTNPED